MEHTCHGGFLQGLPCSISLRYALVLLVGVLVEESGAEGGDGMYAGDASEDGLANGAVEHLDAHLGTLPRDAAHIVFVGVVTAAGDETGGTTAQGACSRADEGRLPGGIAGAGGDVHGSASGKGGQGHCRHLKGKLLFVDGVQFHIGLGALLSGISHYRRIDGIAQLIDFLEILIDEGALFIKHVHGRLRGLFALLHGQQANHGRNALDSLCTAA